MRLERSLAGSWHFQLDPEGAVHVGNLAPDRPITVPLPWQAAFPELESYSGYAWYRLTLTLEEAWLGGELLLKFGAVDYWCQVFINGQLAAEHEGGYTPFTLPIRTHVHAGENQIAVRVYDAAQANITLPRWYDTPPTTSASSLPPFDARNIPHGKQEWYLNVGGIWQDVILTAVPKTYITQVHVTPDIHSGRASVQVEIANAEATGELSLSIVGKNSTIPLAANQARYTLDVVIDQPQLWTPETPNLYTATVRIQAPSGADELNTRFGFREITTRDGRLLLNGQPLFLLSALDQDLYPDTIYTVPSEAFLRDEFQKAKALGLNNLRCHIKPPDPLYLDLADELGLLVWAEIPSWRTFYPKMTIHPGVLDIDQALKKRVHTTLVEVIARDYNHPSIIIWTIVNEDWGTALALSAADRAWIAELYDECKRLDPTRLAVDNSACGNEWGPNIHVKSDLDDFHIYNNIPDQAPQFVQSIEQFGLRPLWTYSSNGDAQRTGHEPLILSEFGNWGLPAFSALSGADGKEPHWFKLGPWWSAWSGEPGWPTGVRERFERLGLHAIWPDVDAYAVATQWHQFAAMKFEIETMRRQANLAGYVITELTDAYWESNGLLDFNRCPKVYHGAFAAINAPDVIIPQVYSYAAWADQAVRVRLHGSHYSAADWSGALLDWSADNGGAHGQVAAPATERGTVSNFGLQTWRAPTVEAAQHVRLQFALRSAAGEPLAQNHVELLVLPTSARHAQYQAPMAVLMRRKMAPFLDAEAASPSGSESLPASAATGSMATSEPSNSASDAVPANAAMAALFSLDTILGQFGYQTRKQLSAETRLVVTDYPTDEQLQWVRAGGDMLFLSSGASPFFFRTGRGGTYGGAWLASFSWLRPGIYKRLGDISNPLSMPFMHVMPLGTIVGLPYENAAVQSDFLAGQVAGWVNHPAVHTVQFRYGKGRVIMTTFSFQQALLETPADPVAVAMLHDLIDHLTSDACQPMLTANY